MHTPWEKDFYVFRKWCLTNGWVEGMCLCRTGDKGNYEPGNVRVDTRQSNTEEALAKNYTFESPDGVITSIFNLTKFCRENNLDQGHMSAISTGKRKQHKGWTNGN